MRKGGEDLNGSGKEKGSSEESDQEEVGTLYGLGDRVDPWKPERQSCIVKWLGVEKRGEINRSPTWWENATRCWGGTTPPSRHYIDYHNS
ncbi:hypothetical protein MELA_00211 [Candidatus Methylomirabilis lanthanidiphila]|uniref:Uncharacterized protein n=1 Tax=Candidatus Methylomirabilis lanthanidiphila TaxID=2211376 RepID=A0A564ZFC7_9BACT|nr:hypothetical protein MELA_00211 [Candidatus Methylomirabilis lanthanidiphila]